MELWPIHKEVWPGGGGRAHTYSEACQPRESPVLQKETKYRGFAPGAERETEKMLEESLNTLVSQLGLAWGGYQSELCPETEQSQKIVVGIKPNHSGID